MDDIINFLHSSVAYFTYFIPPKKTSTSFRIFIVWTAFRCVKIALIRWKWKFTWNFVTLPTIL